LQHCEQRHMVVRVLRIANKSLEIMQESQTFSEQKSVNVPLYRPNHQIVKSYISEPFRT